MSDGAITVSGWHLVAIATLLLLSLFGAGVVIGRFLQPHPVQFFFIPVPADAPGWFPTPDRLEV